MELDIAVIDGGDSGTYSAWRLQEAPIELHFSNVATGLLDGYFPMGTLTT